MEYSEHHVEIHPVSRQTDVFVLLYPVRARLLNELLPHITGLMSLEQICSTSFCFSQFTCIHLHAFHGVFFIVNCETVDLYDSFCDLVFSLFHVKILTV